MSARFLPACLCVAALSVGAGCAQTITVKVDGPHSAVRLGEQSLGVVPPEGKSVEIPGGVDAVPWQVEREGAVAKGELARTEPNPWILAAALGGVACCVPSAVALGICVANPGVLVAAPLVLVGIGDLGAVTAGCVAPSWFTLPLVSGCGALGMTPAVAALWADAPPAEVVLQAPAGEPRGEVVEPAPVVGMAW